MPKKQKTKKVAKDPTLKVGKIPLKPIFAGLAVMLLVLGLFNAQLFAALVISYVSPGLSEQQTSAALQKAGDTYGGQSRVVIPKIGVDAPIVYGMTSVRTMPYKVRSKKECYILGVPPCPALREIRYTWAILVVSLGRQATITLFLYA